MIARIHAHAIADLKGAKLVGCFDTFTASADRLAAETGCTAYHRLEEMLADPRINIVTIGTPSGAHLEPAVAAAKAGKHVIVEKPLEITLKRCDAIIAACKKKRRQAVDNFAVAIPRRQPRNETGRRCGPIRPAYARRCLCKMVSHASLLR